MDSTVDPLIVAIPSHDGRAAIFTVLELRTVSELLGRSIVVVSGEASNIPRSRNVVLEQVREKYPDRTNRWMLWIDSDIVLLRQSVSAVVEAIRWAEAHHAGVVANYRMASGVNVLMAHPDHHHVADDELQALPDYGEIAMAGLGFAYLNQPLSYMFHADATGEDIHFWRDNPGIHLHCAKQIHLGHKKTVLLTS